MELYHLHLKGIKDDKWKEKKEIIIDKSFINRLGKKVNNFNDCTINKDLTYIANEINTSLQLHGYQTLPRMPLYLIFDHLTEIEESKQRKIDPQTQIVILKELRNLAFQSAIFKREMAMENFRKDNKQYLPSRLHCLYATTEDGIEYWKDTLMDGDMDVFRIEALEEPFKTSDLFIPSESSDYEEMYNNSFGYWNPKFKNIPEYASEYLVQGRVKILEKVAEIK